MVTSQNTGLYFRKCISYAGKLVNLVSQSDSKNLFQAVKVIISVHKKPSSGV